MTLTKSQKVVDEMKAGVTALDSKAIREAADKFKAKSFNSILSEDAAKRVEQSIQVARQTARDIVKAGEAAAIEIDTQAVSFLQKSRLAFLDFDVEPMTEEEQLLAEIPSSTSINTNSRPTSNLDWAQEELTKIRYREPTELQIEL